MHVLVIGGSVFLGRAVADEALAAGHEVTVFNRGRSGPTPPGTTQLTGDRTDPADLEQLAGRRFDLVVDTSGYVPADVARSAGLLADTAGHYVFVSSINAYPHWPAQLDYVSRGVHDGDPTATVAPDDLSETDSYGWLKVGCERAVTEAFGSARSTIARAGLLVGPYDSAVGRLPWWLERVSRGGEVLVPGPPDAPVQLIDARDFARFVLLAVPGTFDLPGPPARDTRADLMAACVAATGADARPTYVSDEGWLQAQGVQFWTELPLWIPAETGPAAFRCDSSAAAAAGLTWRPMAESISDVWTWQSAQRPTLPESLGLAADRERELLAAWHESERDSD